VTLCRWHIEGSVIFKERVRVTIEHGHADRRSDNLSAVAFWYRPNRKNRSARCQMSKSASRPFVGPTRSGTWQRGSAAGEHPPPPMQVRFR
jgi:hypothetical protein